MSDLPTNLKTNPRLSNWLSIEAGGRVEVRSGKVELGQGITTALARIAAQELDVAFTRIAMRPASTDGAPNEGFTSGSLSVQDSGSALRQVCAETRALFLDEAARRMEVSPADLVVRDGEIRVRGAAQLPGTSYWELAGVISLDRDATGQAPPQAPRTSDADEPQRLDLPAKILGQPVFLHDLELPGMLHGRVLHPPSTLALLRDVDIMAMKGLPGVVEVVRDGSFLGVIAHTEQQAALALRKLESVARWDEQATLPDANALPAFLRSQPAETTVVSERNLDAAAPEGRRFAASYAKPFLAHASIAPSCGVARFAADGSRLEVWTHAQGVYPMQRDLGLLLEQPASSITVTHVPGAGCYGHNGADDAACEAVLLARAVPGRAVRLLWSRADELGWSPLGPAMSVDVKATVDDGGRIVDWEHEVWSNGHSLRPGRASYPVFRAAMFLGKPFTAPVAINMPVPTGGGAERNSIPTYGFPRHRVTNHRVLAMPLRTSALRGLGAVGNVFAAESFMDEIAQQLGVDPLAFRLRHAADDRTRAVLEEAARMADWQGRKAREGEGWGLAFARYKHNGAFCAAVAQVDVQRDVRVRNLWLAVDVGRVVVADGVRNQLEGGAIQTVSWATREEVRFDATRVTSDSWESYPILRFSEVPAVHISLLDRPAEKSVGAGEATHGPVAAAIANAVADAVGVRVRELPLTRERLEQALQQA
ncbi:molybdopterin cofactor-binding domain-containing protein [Ramlibacter sp. PS3R-8]|uniref:xanthine dehydrogenase family protein molybdopterin-binding subunit n=1 Tax=Ramlibacter sp. PS3R-8 TaxID=3133437 RepID=UPI0030AC9F52